MIYKILRRMKMIDVFVNCMGIISYRSIIRSKFSISQKATRFINVNGMTSMLNMATYSNDTILQKCQLIWPTTALITSILPMSLHSRETGTSMVFVTFPECSLFDFNNFGGFALSWGFLKHFAPWNVIFIARVDGIVILVTRKS
jgi:hypothetical protein